LSGSCDRGSRLITDRFCSIEAEEFIFLISEATGSRFFSKSTLCARNQGQIAIHNTRSTATFFIIICSGRPAAISQKRIVASYSLVGQVVRSVLSGLMARLLDGGKALDRSYDRGRRTFKAPRPIELLPISLLAGIAAHG
jgi:hypothetical protein